MKKTTSTLSLTFIALFLFFSCNSASDNAATPEKIENTIQSVSYFSDSANIDPQTLNEAFTSINDAIAEIGYPDAGYMAWLIQQDSSNIRFMVEGHWPDQEAYDKIHSDQLYKDAMAASERAMMSLEWVEYHRFVRIK